MTTPRGPYGALPITGQSAEWCRNWAAQQDERAQEKRKRAALLIVQAERLEAEAGDYRAYADSLCLHCEKPPEADGDHTCPCPYPDDKCPVHFPANGRSGASDEG